MTQQAWYLRCQPQDVGTHAILVGDRGRVALATELLDDVTLLNEDRGLTTATGTYRGTRVTISAFGMGAPIAAVVLHELASLGVRTFLRLGTVMNLPPARLGDLVLAAGAVRGESTSLTYLPPEYPAVPDATLNAALTRELSRHARGHVTGLIASFDGFYTQMFAVDAAREQDIKDRMDTLARNGVVAVDMETSAILVAAGALRVRAASLCLASVDGSTHDRLVNDERVAAERDLLEIGLAALAGTPDPTGDLPHQPTAPAAI